MISLQTKSILAILLVICAPFYASVRYFYGGAFLRLLLLGFALNLFALPYLSEYLASLGVGLYPRFYHPQLHDTLAAIALYSLPLHLVWFLFYGLSGDGRYDLDTPGRPPIPFVHPWFIDLPVAALLPMAVFNAHKLPAFAPSTPSWMPFPLPSIQFDPSWFYASVVVALTYAAAAIVSVPAPSFRWFRRRPRRQKPQSQQPTFDVATIAQMPAFPLDTLADIQSRRSLAMRALLQRP